MMRSTKELRHVYRDFLLEANQSYSDIVVLEFTTETIEDIKKVLKQLKTRKGEYREYNYKRGVY